MRTRRISDVFKLNTMLETKPMYFYNAFVECVVRSQPDDNGNVEYWIKYKGRKYDLKGSNNNTNIFETVHIDSLTITKGDYYDY